jgi:hypothetical protein
MTHRPQSHPRGNMYVLTSVLLLCTHAALSSVEVAADGPAVATVPGRLHLSYEVEVVRLLPDDAAAVAQWAELAGQGYRVVAAVPHADGGATMYLERLGARGATLTMPAQIAPATADAIRRRLRERQAEPAAAPQR